MATHQRIVVLGAGYGGLVAALKIARKHRKAEVILVDRSDHQGYTPWFYETATGFLIADSDGKRERLQNTSALSLEEIIKKSKCKNLRFRKAEVTGCDFETKHVFLKGGKTIEYSKLLIALGAETAFFGIKGLKEHGVDMKTIDSALEIRERLDVILGEIEKGERSHCVILVAGAGATGTETVAELANFLRRWDISRRLGPHTIRILLVDGANVILSRFNKFTQKYSQKRLDKLQVEVWVDTFLKEVTPTHATLAPRPLGPEETGEIMSPLDSAAELPYDLLVWAGGIQPNSLTQSLELPKDPRGRILVDPTMQVQGHSDVYAIGDIITMAGSKDERPIPATAWAAIDGADVAASNILSKKKSRKAFKLPRIFPSIIIVGGKWAVAQAYTIPLLGRAAFYVRIGADLRYFTKILPWFDAVRFVYQSYKVHGKND